MIIGINGKIGVGKDTVGEIIQKLCVTNNGPEFEIRKFAGKLKIIASLLTGIPVEKFEDQEFKKNNLSDEWSTVNSLSTRHKVRKDMTVRELLQKLGTEAMREGLHTNVWVNALFADYKLWSDGRKDWYPDWIITDMRFPNEIEAVKERHGITIKVVRSFNHKMGSKETGTLDLTPLHPSETALDDAEFDYEIINDGTIEDLVEKVRTILITENII